MQRFEVAPWSTALKAVSVLGVCVLGAVSWALYRAIPRGTRIPFAETFGSLLLFLPAVILVGSVFFVVTEYRLDANVLEIERLLWTTRLDLEGLDRAWHDPSAMCRSLRIFGNGGLFSITGWFQNKSLGRYRAFVTDPRLAVVLRTTTRVVVLSPAYPRAFLGHLETLHPGVTAEK